MVRWLVLHTINGMRLRQSSNLLRYAQSCVITRRRASSAVSPLRLHNCNNNSRTFATSLTKNKKYKVTNNQQSNNNSSNSNPNEVNKFSSFASKWWDSRSNPLVGMNPVRIKFMREVVHNFGSATHNITPHSNLPLHDKRILDIGCGGGLLTESLYRLGASLVVGLDASAKVVEAAKIHTFHENSKLTSKQHHQQPSDNQLNNDISDTNNGNNHIRYIGGVTVEEFASRWLSERKGEREQSDSSQSSNDHELFDVITALEVIEHVPNPTSLLQAASKLLKPNGILFVSTINRTMKSYGLAIVAAEYISGKVPVGTHDWNQFWSPGEVENMVCSADVVGGGNGDVSSHNTYTTTEIMKQIAVNGMVLEPPFINMQWKLDVTDMDVNWIGAYQKQPT